MNYSPIQHYKEQSVLSMSKGEQLVLLYDEAIKNLRYAGMMLEKGNFETFNKCTQKSKDIFQYLSSILDFNYPVSEDLNNLYYFFNQEIIKAELERDIQPITAIMPIIDDMRNTWITANKTANMNK